jgi:SagB-type dehydrogenase family enzyme
MIPMTNRSFLKDTVRLEVDFALTAQNRGLPPPPFEKPTPDGLVRVPLPEGREALHRVAAVPLSAAVANRRSLRAYDGAALSQEELAALLWGTQGVQEVLHRAAALRTVPSAGARHAFETYLAVSRVEGLTPGLYRYLPFSHALVCLRKDPAIGQRAALACLRQGFVAGAAVVFFWTVLPERMEWRYGKAAYKVLALDAGHVCQNLYLTAEAMGAGTCAIAAYDQAACDSLLGVDGEDEFTFYVAPVGKRRQGK